jgi:hypothetical protein
LGCGRTPVLMKLSGGTNGTGWTIFLWNRVSRPVDRRPPGGSDYGRG